MKSRRRAGLFSDRMVLSGAALGLFMVLSLLHVRQEATATDLSYRDHRSTLQAQILEEERWRLRCEIQRLLRPGRLVEANRSLNLGLVGPERLGERRHDPRRR